MEYIKGITFAPFAPVGTFERKEAYNSLNTLIERTNANMIMVVPNGLQETAQSQSIDFTSLASTTDSELIKMIDYIHSKGLKVALKPTVNCKNGTWRAHICFFDVDVPCEPKWSVWFRAYSEFQLHYASIAEKTGCEMFIAGCEMVQAEKRESEWRTLFAEIRKVYHGHLTYNTDKYQEGNVTFWDALDSICSSGYYPIDMLDNELARIEKVVKKYNKPFFFAEIGCKSTAGSQYLPNDFMLRGDIDMEGQAKWYTGMFEASKKYGFIEGFVIWAWSARLYSEAHASKNDDYDIAYKPAEKVVKAFYSSISD